MFPMYLDNAKVLEYTIKGNYGYVETVDNGEIIKKEKIVYYAITKYDNDNVYYTFGCNESFEVISDFVWEDVSEAEEGLPKTIGQEIIWLQR